MIANQHDVVEHQAPTVAVLDQAQGQQIGPAVRQIARHRCHEAQQAGFALQLPTVGLDLTALGQPGLGDDGRPHSAQKMLGRADPVDAFGQGLAAFDRADRPAQGTEADRDAECQQGHGQQHLDQAETACPDSHQGIPASGGGTRRRSVAKRWTWAP